MQMPNWTAYPIVLTQNVLYTNLILAAIGLQSDDTSRPSILLVTKLLRSLIAWVLENDVRLDLNASRVALNVL